MVIVSDSEPAFASEVMQELAKTFGAKNWDFGPVSSPQHHGQIERRVEPYNRAIKGAMAAGMITCWRTLEVVLTSALITQTQLMVTYGSIAFTRHTGAVPRTHRELYTTSCDNLAPSAECRQGLHACSPVGILPLLLGAYGVRACLWDVGLLVVSALASGKSLCW